MPVRRTTAARLSPVLVIVSAFALTVSAVGCSDDTKSEAKQDATTTTAAGSSDSGEDDGAAPDAPTTTVEFDAAVAALEADLDAADGDFCKVALAAQGISPGAPTDASQTKALYEGFARVLRDLADALPADSDVNPEVLRSAAEDVIRDGEAADYDPEELGSEAPPSLMTEEVTAAMTGVQALISENCSG